jgi:hypothetical protein
MIRLPTTANGWRRERPEARTEKTGNKLRQTKSLRAGLADRISLDSKAAFWYPDRSRSHPRAATPDSGETSRTSCSRPHVPLKHARENGNGSNRSKADR